MGDIAAVDVDFVGLDHDEGGLAHFVAEEFVGFFAFFGGDFGGVDAG